MDLHIFLQDSLFLQVSGITPGRAKALVVTVVALTSLILGRMAMSRSKRHTSAARPMAIAALSLGLVAVAVSVLHMAETKTGFGTGSGLAGNIVAFVLAVMGMIFGWLAMARSRQTVKK